MTRQFHRPARLDPETAESLEGSEDTAVSSETSHRAAQALVGGFPDDDAFTREGVVHAIATEGVDDIAELWADSPATTLPGTLWRLFLVREWLRREPELVARRYATVVDLSADDEAAARFETAVGEARRAPSPEALRESLEAVLTGNGSGDVVGLAPLLSTTAGFLRALAAGSTPEWITDDTDELSYRVTRRETALTATAAELDDAARRAASGRLD